MAMNVAKSKSVIDKDHHGGESVHKDQQDAC